MAAQGRAAVGDGSRGSEILQRLKRGEIGLEEYLDAKVDRAVERLGSLVTDDERQALRDVLREHALADPVIAEYVRRLTDAER